MNFIARFHLLHFHIFCLSRRIDFWIWDFVWKAGSWVRNQTLCEIINLVVCGNQPPISLTNYQLIIARRVIDHLFHWKYALNFDLHCVESTLYFVRIKLCKRKKLLISSGGRERGGKVLQKRKVTRPASAIFVPSSHPPLNLNFFLFWTKKEEIGKEHKFSAPQICTRNLISTKMSCLLTKKKGFVARHSRNAGMFPVAILSSWFIWKVLMHFLLVTHSLSFELSSVRWKFMECSDHWKVPRCYSLKLIYLKMDSLSTSYSFVESKFHLHIESCVVWPVNLRWLTS